MSLTTKLSYEMLIGVPPFYDRNQNYDIVYQMIRENDVAFGTRIQISDDGKDIIRKVTISGRRWFTDVSALG